MGGSEVTVRFFVQDVGPQRAARTLQETLERFLQHKPTIGSTPVVLDARRASNGKT